MIATRKPLIAGNWKMYKTPSQACSFIQQLIPRVASVEHCDIAVAPPYPALTQVRELLRPTSIWLAAQDCHWEPEGAFTGAVSAEMLRESGCGLVIIGHSERRQYFGETDESVNRKLKAVLRAGLSPVFCLGETLAEREAGGWQDVVQRQLTRGLDSLTPQDLSRTIIAYEPVWAIGTGKTATPDVAQEVHAFLRNRLASIYQTVVAEQVRVLYGGSVKPGNTAELMNCPDIDGALVGGASLDVDSFSAIVANSR